jgi:hypothetical protein
MDKQINRRQFIQITAAGSALCVGGSSMLTFGANPKGSRLISPGCRGTKVKVARLFMGRPNNPYWPKPNLNLKEEIRFYKAQFAKLEDELADVDFAVEALVT